MKNHDRDESDIGAMFGRLTESGDVAVFWQDGETVTRIDIAGLYPVGSDLGSRYEHANGIVISQPNAKKIGLKMED